MTAADSIAAPDRAEAARWSASLLVVLLLHGAAALLLMSRHVVLDMAGPKQPAVMIDLAPLPAPSPPAPSPPEPVTQPAVQPQPLPEPPPPPPPEIEIPKLEPSPAPKPVVALPQKPPPKPKPRPVERPPEAPPMPPPPAAPAIAAPPAPAAAPPAANAGAVRASWQTLVAAQLERNKRYPRLAQEQRQEGVVTLRFAVDRQGHVLSSQIAKGSSFSLLDEEVLALIQRAQPLPAPPPEVPGARIELTVPVQFSLRGRMQ